MNYERMSAGLLDVKLAGSDVGTFSGYGATFGNVDSYGDTIRKGAFARTLKDWGTKGKFPKMLLQHGGMGVTSDDMMPVGQWTHMEETDRGLKVEGRLFALNTERGQYIYEGLKSGELDSLSIGYMVPEGGSVREKAGGASRALIDIDLWEVSIVTFPADQKSLIQGVKMTPDKLREFEGSCRDGGLSQREAVIASSVLRKWLQSDSGAPISLPRDEVVPDDVAAILASLEKLSDSTWSEVFKR
jgi:HK97 family phage prohead protease